MPGLSDGGAQAVRSTYMGILVHFAHRFLYVFFTYYYCYGKVGLMSGSRSPQKD
jgi:hypothetical protein